MTVSLKEKIDYTAWRLRIAGSGVSWRPRPHGRSQPCVVILAPPHGDFRSGKVKPQHFFPKFSSALARRGIQTRYARGVGELARCGPSRLCVICVANEERDEIQALAPCEAGGRVVFNAPSRAPLIADKKRTNEFLASHGILVPTTAATDDAPVFSNANARSAAPAFVVTAGHGEPSRYNTRFIDTTVDVGRRRYFTALRLLCVGSTLIHAYVRARPASEEPSVHTTNTPQDPELLETLQHLLVFNNSSKLIDLARKLGDALGPGFYGHDVLVERGTSRLFVCETGWKFEAFSFAARMAPIAKALPSHRIFFDGTLPIKSAAAFSTECHGLMLREQRKSASVERLAHH